MFHISLPISMLLMYTALPLGWDPCRWTCSMPSRRMCFPHFFLPLTEGKCTQGVQGVPFQPKKRLSALKVQINVLPQWETEGPKADFVPCFLTVCPPPTTSSLLPCSRGHTVSVETQASKDYSLSNWYHVYPCLLPFKLIKQTLIFQPFLM